MEKRKHEWISNSAFTAMTGVRKVCMVCRQPSNTAPRLCDGPHPTPKETL